ncbi:hypothetical protein OPAG_08343 [Rhodococcus opacus PD630]|uniref:hypothetical protein n=1 Tax=Rhodococcus opacus TaxID=37919 RepID=UPI00029CB883|nr:hypothetical protein [Rhodococcus opacus]EHI39112.1 hypothetical protein OPAG_08343 [Rhodococcus opacus PD630]
MGDNGCYLGVRAEFYVDGDMIRGFGVELSWQCEAETFPSREWLPANLGPLPALDWDEGRVDELLAQHGWTVTGEWQGIADPRDGAPGFAATVRRREAPCEKIRITCDWARDEDLPQLSGYQGPLPRYEIEIDRCDLIVAFIGCMREGHALLSRQAGWFVRHSTTGDDWDRRAPGGRYLLAFETLDPGFVVVWTFEVLGSRKTDRTMDTIGVAFDQELSATRREDPIRTIVL